MKNNQEDTETKKKSKSKGKIRFYYSLLTVSLLVSLVYFSYSAILNVSKCLNMPGKLIRMKALNKEAIEQNRKLKNQIANFESLHSLEAIARNNLKMAGEDEILVIVNKEQPVINEENKSNKKSE